MSGRPPIRRVIQASVPAVVWTALLLGSGRAVLGGQTAYLPALGALLLLGGWALDAFVPAWSPWMVRRGRKSAPGEPPRVALTFDDGPSEDTPAVLNALAAAQVRATFFMLGQHVERHPEIAQAVALAGHVVGNHTWSHRTLALLAPRQIAREIDRTEHLLGSLGLRGSFFRPPRGFQGPWVRRVLKSRRLRLVGWTRGAWDSEPRTPDQIAQAAACDPRDGDILLLHDGAGTPGYQRRDATAKAIAAIVDCYRRRGFAFVTLPELLDAG